MLISNCFLYHTRAFCNVLNEKRVEHSKAPVFMIMMIILHQYIGNRNNQLSDIT